MLEPALVIRSGTNTDSEINVAAGAPNGQISGYQIPGPKRRRVRGCLPIGSARLTDGALVRSVVAPCSEHSGISGLDLLLFSGCPA